MFYMSPLGMPFYVAQRAQPPSSQGRQDQRPVLTMEARDGERQARFEYLQFRADETPV